MKGDFKSYAVDVEVIQKSRLRVIVPLGAKPTKNTMLKVLKDELYDDIIDEETIEVQSVESMTIFQIDDLEEDEEVE